jgi:hypothetical protein
MSRGAALERVLAALRAHGSRVEQRGDSWMAQCPAEGHDDRTASLSVAQGDVGAVVCCQVGCDTGAAVLPPLKLAWRDLFDQPRKVRDTAPRRVAVEYRYTDERGEVLFVKVRYEPKGFTQKRPDGRGGWIPNLGDVPRVLYRLGEVLAAIEAGHTVYLVEGEKDADRLAVLGRVATCNFDGAAKEGQRTKWRREYGDTLRGADVVIIADRDDAGMAHARAAAADLSGKAKSVVIMLPAVDRERADISDHLDAGLTVEQLVPLPAEEAAAPEASPAHKGDDGGEGKRSQASRLVELALERFDLVMSEDGRPYGVVRNGPNIALPLRGSRGLRTRLAAVFADVTRGTAPSQSALADALAVLEGYAARKDPVPVHLRLARHGDGIVIDLGTADGRCVIVGPDGWRREPRSPVLFRRTALTSVIPDPVRAGDGLARLAGLLNATDTAFRLLAGWMVSTLIPEIPHPILAFKGEQGTGKTTAARCVVQIIDPSPAPLRTAPRDVKQWVVVASASWAVCLDNVNAISGWLSETLCRAVTGDGNVDRALYTDDDVTVLAFRRIVMMTSIDAGHLDGDLAERLLLVELQPIAESARRTDAELNAAYVAAQPAVFASLLDLTADVLKRLPNVRPETMPRMADFACVLQAVDDVTGWDTLATYAAAADTIAADVLEGDQFGKAVDAMVREQPEGTWTGTALQLLELVTPEKPPKNWPKDATRTGGRLKRIAPLLRQAGISFDDAQREPQGNRSRLYTLTLNLGESGHENNGAPAPAAPAAPGVLIDLRERAGAGAGAGNTRVSAAPGRRAGAAGAGPGARDGAAPAPPMASEQQNHASAGAAGAAGAGIAHISEPDVGEWPDALPDDWGEWPA